MVSGKQAIYDGGDFTIENNILKGKVEPYETGYTSLGMLIFETLKNNPTLIGQLDAITEIEDTFAEIYDRVVKCALWMKKQGVGHGDIVAVCSYNHLDTMIPCIACLCLGAVFTTWDEQMNLQNARHYMALSQPKVIFAVETAVAMVMEAAKIEVFESIYAVFGDYPGAVSFSKILSGHSAYDVANFRCTELKSPRDTAVILYSSGTTGLPKGVELSHSSILCQLQAKEGLNFNGVTPMWFSSISWISGILLPLHAIISCTRRILAPGFDEEIACKLVEKYKVTWLFLGPSMANRLIKSGFVNKYDLSSLKHIFMGGASLKKEAEDKVKRTFPNVTILQAYGLTEICGLGTSQMKGATSGSCGIVCKNVQVKIIDPETGKILGANQNGELCLSSPTLMTGYFRNPEATKNAIDEEGWLHSGDLGYYNEKGEIFIVDRLKEIIKFREYQVPPSEIEDFLQTHPAVKEVAVVPVPHPTDDEHPVAYVSRKPGANVTEQELIDMVANNLMDICKLRGGLFFLDELPHTTSGKIARKVLKELAVKTVLVK